jgi:hypothetical protein
MGTMARALERLTQIQKTISPPAIAERDNAVKASPERLWRPRDQPFDSAPPVKVR